MENQPKGSQVSVYVSLLCIGLFIAAFFIDFAPSNILFVKSALFRYTLLGLSIVIGLALAVNLKFKEVEKQYSPGLIALRLAVWAIVAFGCYGWIGCYVAYVLYRVPGNNYTVECKVARGKSWSKNAEVILEAVTGETYRIKYNPLALMHRELKGKSPVFPEGAIFANGNKLELTGRKTIAGFAIDSIAKIE